MPIHFHFDRICIDPGQIGFGIVVVVCGAVLALPLFAFTALLATI